MKRWKVFWLKRVSSVVLFGTRVAWSHKIQPNDYYDSRHILIWVVGVLNMLGTRQERNTGQGTGALRHSMLAIQLHANRLVINSRWPSLGSWNTTPSYTTIHFIQVEVSNKQPSATWRHMRSIANGSYNFQQWNHKNSFPKQTLTTYL